MGNITDYMDNIDKTTDDMLEEIFQEKEKAIQDLIKETKKVKQENDYLRKQLSKLNQQLIARSLVNSNILYIHN